MAYTLVVKVSGLCLFVPSADGRTLWGLMVKAHDHGGHMDPHVAAVVYDEGGVRKHKRLDGHTNTIGGKPGADMRDQVREIPGSFSKIHRKRAPASWFNAGGGSVFAARVSITGSIAVTPEGGAVWEYDGDDVQLQTHIACTIPMTAETPIRIETAEGPLTLTPKAGETLTVEFYNVPESDLEPNPGPFPPPALGSEPKHFGAYVHFLQIKDSKRPHYAGGQARLRLLGVNPYACLTLPGCSEDDPECP
jgi:hypothetical protein